MTALLLALSAGLYLAAGLAALSSTRRRNGRPGWLLVAGALVLAGLWVALPLFPGLPVQTGDTQPIDAVVHAVIATLAFVGMVLIGRRQRTLRERAASAEIERRKAEAFAEAGSDWFWETDRDLRFTFLSDGVEAVSGVPAAFHIGKTRTEIAGENARSEKWQRHLADLRARRPFRDFRYQRRGPDGSTQFLSASGKPLFDADGAFLGYVGIGNDLTERVAAEERAHQANARLAAAIDAFREPVALWDSDDRLALANPAFWAANAEIPELAIGLGFEDFVRALAERRMVPDAIGREEEWIADRLARRKQPGEPIEQRRDNGRWAVVHEQRLANGEIISIVTDITRQKAAERRLAESQQRLRDFAASAADWLWEQDADLRFSYISQDNAAVTGLAATEHIGKTRHEIGIEGISEEELRAHDALLAERRPFSDFRFSRVRPDGGTVHMSISGKPVFDAEGRFQGYRGTGRDVSAMVEAEISLKAERDRAEAANRAKSDFLANMSHELRTPLNAIIGYADLMLADEEEALSGRHRDYTRDMLTSGRHLLELINDLLDSAKIEAGQMTLSNQTFALLDELADTIALIAPLGEQRNVAVTLEPDPAAEAAQITTDPRAFRQIVLNLLSNAVKFCAEDSTIRIALEARDRALLLRVHDRGPGIAEADLEKIFERFVQAGSAERGMPAGTGIGLPLSRALAEMQGGSLHLESRPGEGTTAVLHLPDCLSALPREARPADGGDENRPDADAAARGARILIAEDHPVNRTLLGEMLKRDGARVETAENGQQAVAAFLRSPFDLVFMDVQMPEMDGLEATRAIRDCGGAGRTVPIVAVTANAFEEQRRDCLQAGMNDHITKPISREAVRHVLRRWLPAAPAGATAGGTDEDKPMMQSPGREDDRTDDRMGHNPSAVRIDTEVLGEMRDLVGAAAILEILGQLADDSAQRLADLAAGLAAGDAAAVRASAHSLKGAFANVGGQTVQAWAGELEGHARSGDLAAAAARFDGLEEACAGTLRALEAEIGEHDGDDRAAAAR